MPDEFAVFDHVRELDEVLEDRVLEHLSANLFPLFLILLAGSILVVLQVVCEDSHVHILEAAQGVDGTAISFRCFEEIFGSWIESLVWIFSGSSSSPTTRWRVAHLPIWPLGVLLLHMSVQCRI